MRETRDVVFVQDVDLLVVTWLLSDGTLDQGGEHVKSRPVSHLPNTYIQYWNYD